MVSVADHENTAQSCFVVEPQLLLRDDARVARACQPNLVRSRSSSRLPDLDSFACSVQKDKNLLWRWKQIA